MITIQRNLRRDGYYSEWMRTKNGELAAVSVMARETRDKPLYAYAYAHSVLTFFRLYDTDNAAKMSKKQFTETILEHVKYAYQKLHITLGTQENHPLPFIGGCFTVKGGGVVCFVIGDGAVKVYRGKKTELLEIPLKVSGENSDLHLLGNVIFARAVIIILLLPFVFAKMK